jgi:hypothetical protein
VGHELAPSLDTPAKRGVVCPNVKEEQVFPKREEKWANGIKRVACCAHRIVALRPWLKTIGW